MSLDTYEALGVIVKGELKPQASVSFRQAMKQFADGPVVIRVDVQQERGSAAQRRYWFGVVVKHFSEHCGYDKDEMHEVLKAELLPSKDVEFTDPTTGEVRVHRIPGSTQRLTKAQWKELIDKAQRLGAEMDIYIPDAA